MKMQKLAILMVAGLLMLPMAFLDIAAKPTVININYSGQSEYSGENIILSLHALGFPGEELEWSGTVVVPADQETQPSMTFEIDVIYAYHSDTHVDGFFELTDPTNPDVEWCYYWFDANVYGEMELWGYYQPPCPDVHIEDYKATVVINT
jgi:hypothetical protein